MRAAWFMLLFSACQPMEPGNPLEPVTIEPCECECEVCPEVVATDEQAEGTDEKPADTDATDAPVESVGTDGDPFAQDILAKEATEDESDEAPVDESEVAVMPDAVAWQATQTQPGWGVQLVSVVPGGSPAQAILRLPDGTNQVVRAGDLLPTVGIVVLAIGQNRIQLAQVKPQGDFATVEAVQMGALYPNKE